MRRSILVFVTLLLAAAPGLAQGIWYVDPVDGSDAGTGHAGDPWQTLTHALSQAVAGEKVELDGGLYDRNRGVDPETYPIVLKDGVDVYYPGTDHAAVFDAGGTTSAFRVNSVFAGGVSLSGVTITACTIGVEVTSGGGATGSPFDVQDCIFQNFSTAGFRATLDTGATHLLWVRDSAFSAGSATHGIRIQIRGANTAMALSVIQDNTVTDGGTGIAVECSDGGRALSTVEVKRNDVSSATVAGMHLLASSSASRNATNSSEVHSNRLSASPVGLLVESTSTLGLSSDCDGAVMHNWISGNAVNVLLRTTNNGFSEADLTPSFTGNLIVNATGDGVVLDVTLPAAGATNNLPDLGTVANYTGRNTFKNNAGFDLVLDGDMANYLNFVNLLQAANNFWTQPGDLEIKARISLGAGLVLYPVLAPWLLDSLSVTLSPNSWPSNTPRTITVSAANVNTAFVDNDDPTATIGQMLVAVRKDATTLTVEPAVFLDGSGFLFDAPALPDGGTWFLDIALPGGQGAIATFKINRAGGGGGGSSTGCFVATAAHGDEDAREVRVLRRFRDDYLLASEPGRAFVRGYYEHGPAAADWIGQRDWARQTARAALAGPVFAAEGLLRSTPAERFALAVLLLGGLFWLTRRR